MLICGEKKPQCTILRICVQISITVFSSKDKIKNDSGYACFTKPINPDAITSLRDFSYGMVRLEIRAQKSGIHLGYKKRDYYEINSAALKFVYK